MSLGVIGVFASITEGLIDTYGEKRVIDTPISEVAIVGSAIGASYMGISQVFAAAGVPKGLKAIFPQVPGADVFRDVVASGGQLVEQPRSEWPGEIFRICRG